MRNAIISLILLMTPLAPAFAQAPAEAPAQAAALREDAPDRHVVVPGDTLWGISGRFLKDPWRWPELWRMNQEQLRNPHRIYPGDVLVLDRSTQPPQLRVLDAGRAEVRPEDRGPIVKLSPKARVQPLGDQAIPAISPSALEPFLSRPLVVGKDELDRLPVIMATEENRVHIGTGGVAYVTGLTAQQQNGAVWQVFRRGDALVDPESNEVLGYQAIYLGEARVNKLGDPSTIQVTRALQEITTGDRLLPAARTLPTFSYAPRAPWRPVRGRIVSTYENMGETGPLGIVALSKGSNDGLEVGHVLAIYRSQSTQSHELRMSPLYGQQGITWNNSLRPYHPENITPRDAPLVTRSKPITEGDIAKLPDERYGLVMVFRTFDRAAFGLVMQASRPVAVNDLVTNP